MTSKKAVMEIVDLKEGFEKRIEEAKARLKELLDENPTSYEALIVFLYMWRDMHIVNVLDYVLQTVRGKASHGEVRT